MESIITQLGPYLVPGVVFSGALFLVLTACFHHSPELAILAPFGEGDLYLFDDSTQANYVQFADPTTASVFGDYVRSGRLRVAPKDQSSSVPKFRPRDCMATNCV
jgi:hypothetical protein